MYYATIVGLYEYDPSIFDDMVVPEELDKDDLIDTILFQNAELGLLYTEPELMKSAITRWSKISQYKWEKWANTLELEYNPIYNKNYTETEAEVVNRDVAQNVMGTDTNKVSAYDDTNFANRTQHSNSTSTTGDEDVLRSLTREGKGNIGVTTTQKLINEERKVAQFNIYDNISEDFRHRFCIMVY